MIDEDIKLILATLGRDLDWGCSSQRCGEHRYTSGKFIDAVDRY